MVDQPEKIHRFTTQIRYNLYAQRKIKSQAVCKNGEVCVHHLVFTFSKTSFNEFLDFCNRS